jgi:hypothetical protein
MALETFTRTTKVYYEQISNAMRAGMRGIEQFLFGIPDIDTSANFAIDKLIVSPYGVAFRRAGEQSAVRAYSPGTGEIIEVPRTSEKTQITETMKDSVIAGIEDIAGQNTHEMKLYSDILRQHSAAHQATKAYLAWYVMREGIFAPKGLDGQSIGLEYDFGRAATQDITYDFTAAGATIDEALGALYDVYRAKDGNPADMVMTLGTQWLEAMQADSSVLERMRTNLDNRVMSTYPVPPELQQTQGLYLIGQYLIPGRATPVWITTYSPESQYVAYSGATAEDFFPSDEAVVYGVNAPRYRVLRGVDAFDESMHVIRVAGDLVFDTFSDKDPIVTWMRSQTRYIFVPANVDHTGRSTGTFE